MKIISCRKCGETMDVYQNCPKCKKPIEFICHNCNFNTEKEIHTNCIIEKIPVTV